MSEEAVEEEAQGGQSSTSANGAISAPYAPLPRSTVKLSRNVFSMILNLTERQPWLKEKQPALLELIDDCSKHEQQLLICELLERFTFLDGRQLSTAIQAIADYIQSTLALTGKNCAISGSDNGRHADSSHMVVYALKSAQWQSSDWNTSSFVSSLKDLSAEAAKGNLVLVDEFIGTGGTAEKKVKWLKAQLASQGASPRIFFAAVAGMEAGINRLAPQVDGVFAAHILRRGISDYYQPPKADENITDMKLLETDTLSSEGKRGMLSNHSLGYKGSESLYSRVDGNTPNNVFPIFWWDSKKDGSQRLRMLSCM